MGPGKRLTGFVIDADNGREAPPVGRGLPQWSRSADLLEAGLQVAVPQLLKGWLFGL